MSYGIIRRDMVKAATADSIESLFIKAANMYVPVEIMSEPEHIPEYLPQYEHTADAGMDVRADIPELLLLPPHKTVVVPTGLYVGLPKPEVLGQLWELQVRPRSGLASKDIGVINSPGTIDAGYRGEIKVLLINHGDTDFWIVPNAKIAQLVLAQVFVVQWKPVDILGETSRNQGGFGSTGIV